MSAFLTGVQLSKRRLVGITIPYLCFLCWYFVFSNEVLLRIIDESPHLFPIYNASFNFLVSCALILGSLIRMEKSLSIGVWVILSTIAEIFIVLCPVNSFQLAVYLISGVAYGMGLLAFLAYFRDLTVPEERGRVAGLMGLFVLPFLPVAYSWAITMDALAVAAICVMLGLGSLVVLRENSANSPASAENERKEASAPERRTVVLYLIPWVLYSVINVTLAKTISFHISQNLSYSSMMTLVAVQNVVGGLGAIIGGVIADLFGRKASLTFGLTVYGASSAISGLAKEYGILCLSHIGSGLTWGILITVYVFLVWGDLEAGESCFPRYWVGALVFFLSMSTGALSAVQTAQIPLVAASITSCLLIFLSNVPLILAPELLPSDLQKKFFFKWYLSLVKRIR